jgi:1-acyl-sn-glycerol-3-phosphate acyltransferase
VSANGRPFLYPLLRTLAVLVLRIFFRKIVVRADHPVPDSGPLIFASNHPNGVMDPPSLIYVTRRTVRFLAKSGLLKFPVTGRLLRWAGVLPVYRGMDARGEVGRNRETFEACHRILSEGGAIGIFPEGLSHTDPELKRLKTGAARIGLEAEALHDFRLGVRIVPVSLASQETARFRSVLGIRLGEPIPLEPFRDRYQGNPKETIREVTELLRERLLAQTLHLDHLELSGLVENVTTLYREELAGDPGTDRFEVKQHIARAVERFRTGDPDTFRRLEQRVKHHMTRLRRLNLHDEALRDYTGPVHRLRWLAGIAAWVIFGLPFALYGTVNNIIPWFLARTVMRIAKNPLDAVELAVYTGLVVFPLFYAAQSFFCWSLLGPIAAAVYALTLPTTGFYAVKFWRQARAVWRRIRLGRLALRRPERIARLKEERDTLIAEFNLLRDRYLEALNQP